MDSAVEAALRTEIIRWTRERADANGGFLHRDELLSFRIGGRDLPLHRVFERDSQTAGLQLYLSLVATANDPYDDLAQ